MNAMQKDWSINWWWFIEKSLSQRSEQTFFRWLNYLYLSYWLCHLLGSHPTFQRHFHSPRFEKSQILSRFVPSRWNKPSVVQASSQLSAQWSSLARILVARCHRPAVVNAFALLAVPQAMTLICRQRSYRNSQSFWRVCTANESESCTRKTLTKIFSPEESLWSRPYLWTWAAD